MNTVSIGILDSSKCQDGKTKYDILGKIILVSSFSIHKYVSNS